MPVLTDASMTTITDALNRWRTEMIPHGELLARQVADIDAAHAELTALRAKPDAQVDTTAPLVSDDRIIQSVYDLTYATESAEVLHAVRQMMHELRDEYEAARKERAPVAVQPVQADDWQPVTNGVYHTDGPEVLDVADEVLRIAANGEIVTVYLQPGHRICKSQAGA